MDETMKAHVIFDQGGEPVAVALVAGGEQEVIASLHPATTFDEQSYLDAWYEVPLLNGGKEVEQFAMDYMTNLGERQDQFRIRGEQ